MAGAVGPAPALQAPKMGRVGGLGPATLA